MEIKEEKLKTKRLGVERKDRIEMLKVREREKKKKPSWQNYVISRNIFELVNFVFLRY